MVFVCFFVCLSRSESWRSVRSRVAYFEEILCHGLWVDFDVVYWVFFGRDCRFSCPRDSSFFSIGGATIFAKLRSKIVNCPKFGGKDCAHNFV